MSRYDRAADAFEAFSGHEATDVSTSRLPGRDVTGWRMGPTVGIAYEAVRDGKKSQYFHEFAKDARPDLVASEDGKQLFLVDGQYTVTDRGIEDMPELFIVNPKSRRGAAPKKRTARMATPARNSKGRFVKGGGRRRYKSNPGGRRRRAAAPRRRRAARQTAIFQANPKRRRSPARRRAAAPGRRRYRRNPGGGSMLRRFGSLVVPAAFAGAGAVLSEVFMGYLPIPAMLKQGVMRHVTKGAVGLGLGWAVATFLKQKKLGAYVAAGAVVIAVHDAIKEMVSGVPGIPQGGFNGMGYANSGRVVSFGRYVAPALPSTPFGRYVPPVGRQFAGASQAYAAPGGETGFAV